MTTYYYWEGRTPRMAPDGDGFYHLAKDHFAGTWREYHPACPCKDCLEMTWEAPYVQEWMQISCSDHTQEEMDNLDVAPAGHMQPVQPIQPIQPAEPITDQLPAGFTLLWLGYSPTPLPGSLAGNYHIANVAENGAATWRTVEYHPDCPCLDCQAIASAQMTQGSLNAWRGDKYNPEYALTSEELAAMNLLPVAHNKSDKSDKSVIAPPPPMWPFVVKDGKHELLSDEALGKDSPIRPVLAEVSNKTGKVLSSPVYRGAYIAGKTLYVEEGYQDTYKAAWGAGNQIKQRVTLVDLNTVDWSNFDWGKGRWKHGRKAATCRGFLTLLALDEHPTLHINGHPSVADYVNWRRKHHPPMTTVTVVTTVPNEVEVKPPRVLKTREISLTDNNSKPFVHRFDEVDFQDYPDPEPEPPAAEPETSRWKPEVSNLGELYRWKRWPMSQGARGEAQGALNAIHNETHYAPYKPTPYHPKPKLLYTNPKPITDFSVYGTPESLVARAREEMPGRTRCSFCIDPPHVCEFDDNSDMLERVKRHLAGFPGLEITYLRKRMVVYNSDGNFKYTPDAYPNGWERNMRWFDGWSLSSCHLPVIFCGEAWCLYFTVNHEDLLNGCHVYFVTPEQFAAAYKDHPKRHHLFDEWTGAPDRSDLIFICSDWCQRARPKLHDEGVNLQTPWRRPRSLAMWIAGDFTDRVTQNKGVNPFSGAVRVWRGDIHGRKAEEARALAEKVRAFKSKGEYQSIHKAKIAALMAGQTTQAEKEETHG